MIDIARNTLVDLYENQNLTTREIADHLGIGFRTVLRRLHQFGIAIRPPGPKRHDCLRSKLWLEKQYIELEKSTVKIAEEIGATSRVVYQWLKNHDIPTRPAGGSLKGKKMTSESRRKMSLARRGKYMGADNWNWKGGYTDPTHRERRSYKAKVWRESVKDRDGHKCRHCGSSDVKLHTHHIKPWRSHPDLRFDVGNGLTLCVPCHQKEHGFSFSAYKNNGEKTRARGAQKSEDIV